MDTNVLNQQSKNVVRNRSMDLTKEVLHEAKVENTGTATDLCDLQPYKCLMCNQKFSKEKYLEAHVFMTHEKNDTKLSSGDNNLETNKSTHDVTKPFSCSHCDFKCSLSSNLKQHQMIHTGEKPFSCLMCGKKFSQKSNLKTHNQSHTRGCQFE